MTNIKKTALIISLNFRVSHTSHLVASYRQMEEIGYKSFLLISEELIPFLPKDIDYITSINQANRVEVAIFWFPAFGNLSLMLKLKRKFHSKIIYVFHEPLENFRMYRSIGLSLIEIAKIYAKYSFTLLMLAKSDIILLPSKKAVRLYENSIGLKFNDRYKYMPLLFDDETKGMKKYDRVYFSYIGTIADDHAYTQYIDFVIQANNDLSFPKEIRFLIATKNTVERTHSLNILESEGRLAIIDGRPLSDKEINNAYAQSFLVWNAYHRTTQSGVLAKASMFGTPAIIMKKNLSEFTIEGKNVECVNDNSNYDEIKNAVLRVWRLFDEYSKNSRTIFNEQFFYRVHNKKLEGIISFI